MGVANSVESIKTSIQRSVSTNISESLQSHYSSVVSNQAVIIDCTDAVKMRLLLQCQKDASIRRDTHGDREIYKIDMEFCTELMELGECGAFGSTIESALNFNDNGKFFAEAIQKTVADLQTLAESELEQNNLFGFGNSISEEVRQYQESVQTNIVRQIQTAYSEASNNQQIQVTNGKATGILLKSTMSVVMQRVFGSTTTQAAETKLASKIRTIVAQTNGGFDLSTIIQIVVACVGMMLVIILAVYFYRRYGRRRVRKVD
jgi:hypothetical protein